MFAGLDKHYTEPELVALYEQQNPRGEDYDFYINLAKLLACRKIVDLGCGTGQLAREFSACGFNVTGVDPAVAMLDYARCQPGAESITFKLGDATSIPSDDFDLAVMTGNVAQIFLSDDAWHQTLTEIHRALRAGGTVAFEARNPAAKAWQDWVPAKTHQHYRSSQGDIESWLQLNEVIGDRVRFTLHCRIEASGNTHVVESELRFRTQAQIVTSLRHCGFVVDHTYGNWQSRALTDQSRTMVFVAHST